MLTNVTETSKQSYAESMISGQIADINSRVLEYIQKNAPCSNNDISRGLNIEYKLVSHARWDLIKKEKIIVCGIFPDKITGRGNECMMINREPGLPFVKKSNACKIAEAIQFCKDNSDSWVSDAILVILNQ